MRQETNNEMDLLLRRLGRHETPASSDHLDADELNSYAENVLPSAARARYTEHLAECARCRELVVQLSSSAGVVVAQETARVSEPSALQKFLASLFSPMVLRFAVPALGLVVVAAIGLMISRNDGPANSPVAEVREQPAQATAPASQPQSSPPSESVSSGLMDMTKSVNKSESKGDTGAETGAGMPPPPPNSAPVVGRIDAEVQDAAKKVEQQQEAPKEAPKATPATVELKSLEPELEKQPAENRVVIANEAAPEKAKTQDRSNADIAGVAPGEGRIRSERRDITALRGAGVQSARREDAADEKDKNEAEIRTVAGRRFRKQGNAWIDTDYSSSRVVISVSRGSEQYRALVADEPAIKQIADTLDGEILVVWKNRAYKIQ